MLTLRIGEDDVFDVFHEPYAIARYAAKFARSYPKAPDAALVVDTWLERHAHFLEPIRALWRMDAGGFGFTPSDSQLRCAAAWCADEHVAETMALLELHFSFRDYCGEFVEPTLADLYWAWTLEALRRGDLVEGWDAQRMFDFVHVERFLARMRAATAEGA